MRMTTLSAAVALAAATLPLTIAAGYGHGDVQPQAVDTTGLEPVGEEWLEENPYRPADQETRDEAVAKANAKPNDKSAIRASVNAGDKAIDQYALAIKIGDSGFNQNCARCHGLQAISGGIAPDVRYLDEGAEGDEWFLQRIRKGYSQDGAYKMPPFEGVLSQEAMWAIRSYIETRPDS